MAGIPNTDRFAFNYDTIQILFSASPTINHGQLEVFECPKRRHRRSAVRDSKSGTEGAKGPEQNREAKMFPCRDRLRHVSDAEAEFPTHNILAPHTLNDTQGQKKDCMCHGQ